MLQSNTPVLLRTAKYYSSTSLYYKVLLQYYSVLSTTPVLLRTTQIYSSTTLYYKVPLQCFSVLQSTTPVLLCTTKYYSSTNSVLQSTNPVLLRYYSLYYKVLICKARSTNVTKCCACHANWFSWLILVTYETSFTMRKATGIILQRHQVLHLPRKMTLMSDVRHIWNVIYNARSNRHHSPTSPNTAPATQNCIPKSKRNLPKTVERDLFGGRFENDPNMKLQNWTRPFAELTFRASETHFVLKITTFRAPAIYPNFTKYRACHKKWHSKITKYCPCHAKWLASLILVTYETSITMPGATDITHQRHQVLHLPRKMTLMSDVRHIWNVIYNARSNRHHPPTSACKYCTCHAKWLSWVMSVAYETSFTMRGATGITLQPHQILRLPRKIAFQNLREIVGKQLKYVSFTMRDRFDHDPSMIRPWSEHEIVISRPPVRGSYFSRFGDAFCIENYNISRSGYLSKFHRILGLQQKVTLQDHQILCLPCKMTLMIGVRRIWKVIYNARSNRCHPPTSPSTVPATKNDWHHWSSWHMKRHLQCAEQQASPSNLTKYCACHAKLHSKI